MALVPATVILLVVIYSSATTSWAAPQFSNDEGDLRPWETSLCLRQWRRINTECSTSADEDHRKKKLECVEELGIQLPCTLRNRMLAGGSSAGITQRPGQPPVQPVEEVCDLRQGQVRQEWQAFERSTRDVCFERCYYGKLNMMGSNDLLDENKTVTALDSFMRVRGWSVLTDEEKRSLRQCLREVRLVEEETRGGPTCEAIWSGVLCTATPTLNRLHGCFENSCRRLLTGTGASTTPTPRRGRRSSTMRMIWHFL